MSGFGCVDVELGAYRNGCVRLWGPKMEAVSSGCDDPGPWKVMSSAVRKDSAPAAGLKHGQGLKGLLWCTSQVPG